MDNWNKNSIFMQLFDILGGIQRVFSKMNNGSNYQVDYDKVIAMFDATIKDPKNDKRIPEIRCAKEEFVNYINGNIWNYSQNQIISYYEQYYHLINLY